MQLLILLAIVVVCLAFFVCWFIDLLTDILQDDDYYW
jgi:hypothetical protein